MIMVLVVGGISEKLEPYLLRIPRRGDHWTTDFEDKVALARRKTMVGDILEEAAGAKA